MRNPLARRKTEERESYSLPFQDYVNGFNYGGMFYPLNYTQTLTGNTESINGDFKGLITSAYQSNGIVFACMLTRMLHFVQARLLYQEMRNSRPGKLWGGPELGILETPWPNGTTMDLLARMITDVDCGGNFYGIRTQDRIVRLRPDWTYIVLGSRSKDPNWEPGDPDTELVGYQYHPGGLHSGRTPYLYFPEQVAHWAPIPDPLAYYRGMSWLTPIIREIQADRSMTDHRQKFFDNGATVNMVVTIPVQNDQEAFARWKNKIEEGHRGVQNAYKTLYLGGGATATPVGTDFNQMDFKGVQGAGEVRIATAARIPATILGISEGLHGSTLNAGNYQSSRRNFADGCLRPLWGGAAGALGSIVKVPTSSRLWYDDRDIPFLQEDEMDAADVRQKDAITIRQLTDAGFDPDAVVDAVIADDFARLSGAHSGLFSVQLQPPGTGNAGGTFNGGTSGGTA